MAIDCTLNTLLTQAKCFEDQCLGEADREAILMYLRVKGLAAAGGTDYSSSLTTLLSDSKAWQIVVGENQRQAINLEIARQNAVANGASIGTTANALKTAARCMMCIGTEFRKSVLLYLECQLNSLGKPS